MFNHSIVNAFLFTINLLKQLVLSRNVNVETRSLWLPVNNQRNGFYDNGPLPGKSYMINSKFLGEKDKSFSKII